MSTGGKETRWTCGARARMRIDYMLLLAGSWLAGWLAGLLLAAAGNMVVWKVKSKKIQYVRPQKGRRIVIQKLLGQDYVEQFLWLEFYRLLPLPPTSPALDASVIRW